MAKRKGNLARAIRLMVRTRPFLLARLAVYGVFFFATIGYTTTFALLLRKSETTVAQVLVLAAAGGLYLLGRRYLVRHLTYVGHAPHVRAMVDVLKGRKLLRGKAQIDAAMRALDDTGVDTTRLYDLERQVGRVVRDVRDVVIEPGSFKPLPGFQKLGKLGWLIGRVATRHVRDGIFGYALWSEDRNVWESARRGVVLYAKDASPTMTTAFRVATVGFLFGLILLGLALWPGWALISAVLNENIFMFLAVIAGFVKAIWVVKTALYDPIGLAWMISMFVRHAEAVEAEPSQWREKLGKTSKRYRELVERAMEGERPAPPPSEAAPKPAQPQAGEARTPKPTDAPTPSGDKPSIIVDDEALDPDAGSQ